MPIFELEGIGPEFPEEHAYWVAPNATLVGRVRLLKHASVWFGAVLRGDNDWIVVGENANVQDNSVIHTDPGLPTTIGANVTVGHKVILHSATVEDGSLIGMGSTLLNRAHIGANCIVGANTLIPEGKRIPDRSLVVGTPGRVVRQLTEAEIAMLKVSADIYVKNYQRFRSALKPAAS
ncbi:MAG TPA: gamma carbonic anhydrase family protein [Rhizomicrobium sp.]|nr:gamma carbonic anhydrase family protein [Rhizomicrobium sp.]